MHDHFVAAVGEFRGELVTRLGVEKVAGHDSSRLAVTLHGALRDVASLPSR